MFTEMMMSNAGGGGTLSYYKIEYSTPNYIIYKDNIQVAALSAVYSGDYTDDNLIFSLVNHKMTIQTKKMAFSCEYHSIYLAGDYIYNNLDTFYSHCPCYIVVSE